MISSLETAVVTKGGSKMNPDDLRLSLRKSLMEADGLRETGDELAAARCEQDALGIAKQAKALGDTSLLVEDAITRAEAAARVLRLMGDI